MIGNITWPILNRSELRRKRPDSRLSFWVITALLLSIAGHVVLWVLFGTFRVDQVAKITLTDTFSIKRSTFDANVLEDVPDSGTNQRNATDESNGKTGQVPVSAEEIAKFTEFNEADIPVDFIVNAEIKMTPAVEQIENIAVDAASGNEAALVNPSDDSMGDPSRDPDQILQGVEKHQQPLDPDHPTISAGDLLGGPEETTLDPSSQARGGGGGGDLVPDGYTSLDEVLGMKGQGDPGKPIWVPTDVLFEFNSAELRDDARLSLMKLGTLIMQRKDSEFILEGHTDLIGDDDYNLALSINRATAIRNWLLDALRLDPTRIKVKGLGKSKPLVLEGTPEEQAQNRRVEVTIQPYGTERPF